MVVVILVWPSFESDSLSSVVAKRQQQLETLQSSASERLRYMPNAAAIHYLSVCQGHKSRSMSSDVTAGATHPLDLPGCEIWSPHVTSRRCSGSRNVAKFGTAPKIRGDFARLYLKNRKSYKKSLNTLGPSTIRCNAQIRCRGQGCSARTRSVPKTKIQFWGQMIPCRKNFAFLFRKNSGWYQFTFDVQISRKSAARKWVKRCVVFLQKS